MHANYMQAQLEAGKTESTKMARPNAGGPSTIDTEDLAESNIEFRKDVQNVTPSGEIYYTNDSQRLCMQTTCNYLALTKLERINGQGLMLQYLFCSRMCQVLYSNDCRETAKKAGAGRRFLFSHATHEKRMSSRAWVTHKRLFAIEQKGRQCIATAFATYQKMVWRRKYKPSEEPS